jgi:hypothetical protein
MDVNVPKEDIEHVRKMVSSVMYSVNEDFFSQFISNKKVVSFYKDLICAMGGFDKSMQRDKPFQGWWDARHLSYDVLALDLDGMDRLVSFGLESGLPIGLIIADDHYRMDEIRKLGPISETEFENCRSLRYLSGKYDGEIRLYRPGGVQVIDGMNLVNQAINYKKN